MTRLNHIKLPLFDQKHRNINFLWFRVSVEVCSLSKGESLSGLKKGEKNTLPNNNR